MKNLILVLFISLISSVSYGQKLTEGDVNKVNNMVFESLSKENSIKMNRVTSGGKLSSCELEFQYTYRDFKSQQGKPVFVVGSFSMLYFKGKNIGYLFKIIPSISDVKTQEWTYQYPEYSEVFVNNRGIEKYKNLEFKCDPRGKCTSYVDLDISLTKLLLTPKPFDGEVKFSLTKGGIDNSFLFSSLLPKEKSEVERRKFNDCMFEVLEQITKDLEDKK